MKLDTISSDVRDMYTQYPFPAIGNYDGFFVKKVLPSIRELQKSEPILRILDAGCGTGSLTCDIAENLRDAEVLGVDFTAESLNRARKRASDRQLTNVRFAETNLLEHNEEFGKFDFVYCQGVLHHLRDPYTGMCNVNRYLRDRGHAFIWLYALLGRRWINDCRDALKVITHGRATREEEIRLIRKIQTALNPPPSKPQKIGRAIEVLGSEGLSSFLKRVRDRTKTSGNTRSEHDENVHLVDMFLHPQDKFYRFREAITELQKAGFDFVEVLDGMSTSVSNALKDIPFPNRIDKYELIELLEKPSGFGFLVRKRAEPVNGTAVGDIRVANSVNAHR
jgi:SAM-dependent methyltransferase